MPKLSGSFMHRSSDENLNRDDGDCSTMNAAGNVVAGVCHPKAENANLAPAWLMYVTVQELNGCGAGCRASGGEVLDGPRTADGKQIAVI